jgi:anthranilate phosphoribosyltransferase
VTELRDGLIKTYDLTPEQLLGRQARAEELRGGDALQNADIIRRILNGEKGPKRDVAVVNAAGALIAAGVSESFSDGVRAAEASIDNGAAAAKLEDLVRFTNENS